MSDITRRELIHRISGTGVALTSGTQAAASLGAQPLPGKIYYFNGLAELVAAQHLQPGDLAMTPFGDFVAVPMGRFEVNASTVFELLASGLQAVLAPGQPINDFKTLREDTRSADWFKGLEAVSIKEPHATATIVTSSDSPAEVITRGGVRLATTPDAFGHRPLAAFDLAPAQAIPDPVSNASAFQSWIDTHAELATLTLPAWQVPLGKPIDFGKRSVSGQGHLTRLTFSGLKHYEDAVTIGSGTGRVGGRAGKLAGLVVDMQDTGRDGVRFVGGLGCGAAFISVENVGRDAFHFEQDANNRFFERAFLEDCEAREVGRYGLCIRLAPFGLDDVQFFNKSRFRDIRLTNCRLADIGILLEDNNGPSSRTKIGGGIKFDNFHAQFRGPGTLRKGCAVYVERSATSDAFIDWITFEDCTFEWNFDEGNANHNGALKVVNKNGSAPLIYDFTDKMTILTNYFRWWDYNKDPAPVMHTYQVRNPQLGIYTNMPERELGTPSGKPGTLAVPASGARDLFDASEAGTVWIVTARTAFSSANRVTALAYGGSSPELDTLVQTGRLSLQTSGATVQATNSGTSDVNVYWSVSRLSS